MAQQNSINLSTIKDAAFLANESYKTFDLVKQENKEKPDPITNSATNSSFEVFNQKNEITNINVIGEVELGFSNI